MHRGLFNNRQGERNDTLPGVVATESVHERVRVEGIVSSVTGEARGAAANDDDVSTSFLVFSMATCDDERSTSTELRVAAAAQDDDVFARVFRC